MSVCNLVAFEGYKTKIFECKHTYIDTYTYTHTVTWLTERRHKSVFGALHATHKQNSHTYPQLQTDSSYRYICICRQSEYVHLSVFCLRRVCAHVNGIVALPTGRSLPLLAHLKRDTKCDCKQLQKMQTHPTCLAYKRAV